MSKAPGIDSAIERAGGIAKLTRALSELEPITQQAVGQWKAKGFVPAPRSQDERNRVLDVETITGEHRHYLNPAVYPDPPVGAAA
jgi:hypothetical protein